MKRLILIEPRDPLLFRDGKPFSGGLLASSLSLVFPATTAGMLRTILGAPSDYQNVTELKDVAQVGPFLVFSCDDGVTWQYALPSPADAVAYDEPGRSGPHGPLEVVPLMPQKLEEGTGVFDSVAVSQFLFGAKEGKPSRRLPQFWTWAYYEKWLADPSSCRSAQLREVGPPPMCRQKRVHSPGRRTGGKGLVFTTDNVEFMAAESDCTDPRRRQLTRFALACQFELPPALGRVPLPRWGRLGGESRIVALNPEAAPPLPSCPGSVRNSRRLRLILATPGLFDGGWRPRWLTPEGASPPGYPEIRLKLVSAAVPRATPISGWDMVEARPKPSRLLAPAGSTYFCEVEGDPSILWLKSIGDGQPARDGFGIVTLGVW
jgi:CRISPR-associated protein Cmr3